MKQTFVHHLLYVVLYHIVYLELEPVMLYGQNLGYLTEQTFAHQLLLDLVQHHIVCLELMLGLL